MALARLSLEANRAVSWGGWSPLLPGLGLALFAPVFCLPRPGSFVPTGGPVLAARPFDRLLMIKQTIE
ncbi:MAG: hypothetical protein A2600_09655 [Candidatus Lambdaproteobacteria bacterium RIFOXYD1_FULL_56_27]|uniref:Uncharacterized protein n=1 Tax=Candidatus Lambdaproteobacteria bacterium RIFOXYD2_FULL_56_26 TaxID=1817773 RepID=A0A1F6GUR5_9PROT|nr:MAG: hypothetical protein A2557_04925 [Candidatus Lambdaproteobacteria bacterium RIFOXYD2_FULL_56_26]OGH02310.1 MAG: hypothetical protein A2426_03405 [Candidatus Lambdaproteobacteria bacterium RIFOXYC1_FULL_56_13]OGH10080.1 MAG: hypothetical protein A2600_09655 [Candidatus Lambdaproteobacteria bacterium RIFOXYD1_FULL_56_27]